MKLVLFGGVQGVGKTTLLGWLEAVFAGKFKKLDPGELFRRYFYRKKLKTTDEIEELILRKLESMPNDSLVIAHWHYAVRRPDGYIPQISFSRLRRIAKSGKIKQVILVALEAPISTLRLRRLADSRVKQRSLSRSAIHEEVVTDRVFLVKHRKLFSQILGKRKVRVLRLTNTDLKATKFYLYKFFKALLG